MNPLLDYIIHSLEDAADPKRIKMALRSYPTTSRVFFECQQLAYEYTGNDKKALGGLTERDVDELGQNLDNWVSVDYYGGLIVGYAWREGVISI